ncbi:MAG: PDZ domain-containing protein [candidate division KSB1 bacterium]|nr:PDZ domain-containing protein [candidate division KSB1 bacterium]
MSYRATLLLAIILLCSSAFADETQLLRQPAISEHYIAFVYANDLWIVDRIGGEARRLTSSPGFETAPHFSPDGKLIAFTATYAGNSDVYVIAAFGGEPQRLTFHPGFDGACGWSADGHQLLIASDRNSVPIRFPQLWTLSINGGPPKLLPIPSAIRACYSANGTQLAYEDVRWQNEWKWYRGGQAKPIAIVSLPDLDQIEVPGPTAVNTHPVYLGELLYFLSDRDGTFNIFEFDRANNSVRQLTHYKDFDVKYLSAGGGLLVFEHAGSIHTLEPVSGIDNEVKIRVHADFPWAMAQWKDVKRNITTASLSPNGVRALFEARGEIFTVPAEKGDVRNLSRSSGAADRAPAWSPDGQKIAWFSDRSGEYRLMIADQSGLSPAREISLTHPTFFFDLTWSPNSKYVAFTDADRKLWILNIEDGRMQLADTDRMAHPERSMVPVWSPDSRWVAYAKQLPNLFRGIMVYSMNERKSYPITDGLSDAVSPAWDRNGKYLYFLASTDMALNTGWLDLGSLERPIRRGVYFAALAKDIPSPLLPESDDEKAAGDESKPKEEKKTTNDKAKKKERADTLEVKIDFDGLTNRVLALPLPLRNYVALDCGSSGIVFISETGLPFYPELTDEPTLTIQRWDMSKRKATPWLSNVKRFRISFNGAKVLYQQGDDWFIAGSESEPKVGEGKLNVELKMHLDPLAEWGQIYRESWRLQRDFFYVPNYHGIDWNAMLRKYEPLLPFVRHREDLNYLIDQMGGELAVGHHFVGGGDIGESKATPVGLLGADFVVENNRYRIQRIYTGENWNPDLRAPLAAPGVDVREGDYLIAINGLDLVTPTTPEQLLEGLADKQTVISVNARPIKEGARNVTVVPIADETSLRSRAWVEDNRRRVDKLSDGKLAYVWLPNTSNAGYEYFNRYYFGQQDRQGAILDERFNGGGYIADYIIDIVARKLRGYFNNPVGDREPWTEPLAGIWGPKVMVINEFAGSGGDMMPYMFRQHQLGPLVGKKTWGGLVGIWDFPPLIDGGYVTVPRGGFFNLDGRWEVENKGIAPDIEVGITPKDVAAGRDPQLERAVAEALRLLKENPLKLQREPAPPIRSKPVDK